METRSVEALCCRPSEVIGQDGDPGFADQEGVLVRSVERASVLQDSQPPGGGLLDHSMVENDHAVRDVFLDPVAGEAFRLHARPVITAVTCRVLEPSEQATELGAETAVFENAPKSVSIVSITIRWAPTASMAAPSRRNSPSRSQSPVSVQLALRSGDMVDRQAPVGLELPQVESDRGDVCDQVVDGLLEGDEYPGLVELGDAANEELHREQRLSAAGRATDERRTSSRQAAAVTSSRPLMPVGAFGSWVAITSTSSR